jgi:two-component sensor histidine kinase
LSGKKLENCDIPPLCNHFLQQLGFEQPSCQKIFSIIAEMVSNSIDHGVLQLSSEIKETPDGFVHYFSERDRRLRNLKDSDFINVNLYWNTDEAPNRLTIEVEDSGMGYSAENTIGGTVKNYSGRGLELIRRMSESIEVFPPGNKIRVIVK